MTSPALQIVLISIRLENTLMNCTILLRCFCNTLYKAQVRASHYSLIFALAASILIAQSRCLKFSLALKKGKHHCQRVQVCSLMCDDTACEYGALVGGECGPSTKYPSTKYVRIGECNRSIERRFTDTLQANFLTVV